jgi:predicted HicB family RNase H-like nuclease
MKVKKPTKKAFFSTNLRINPILAERVKESAEAAKRSMNKEIELALEEKYLV